MKKVYIILLNYNGWEDSIECIESLYQLNYESFRIVLVDNASPNKSMEKLDAWAKGNLEGSEPKMPEMKHLSFPTQSKPLEFKRIDEKEVDQKLNVVPPLTLIQAAENNGFSSGNNLGIRFAQAQKDADFFWLLNNDTVVEPNSLSELVSHYQRKEKDGLGILGGKVRYYFKPDTLQCAAGGYYNKWLAYSKQIGNQELDKNQYSEDLNPDLIIGACMFVSKGFMSKVGLLSEDYFLYYEEQDWAERGRRLGYSLGYCPEATIYHKEGQSIGGTQLDLKGISALSDFYYARNKIIFTRKFHSALCLITVYLSFVLIFINRIRRGRAERIPMLFKILLNPDKRFENS